MYLNDLTVYYQLTDDEDVLFLLKNVEQLDNKAIQHDFIAKFLQVAEKYDLHDHLMQSLLTHLLAMHENAFSLSLERVVDVDDTLKALVLRDLTYFYDLFHSSFDDLEGLNREIFFHFSHSKPIINKEIYEVFSELQSNLAQSTSVEDFYNILYNHYHKYGVGKYGLNKAFRYVDGNIVSINHIEDNTLEQLIGYERQKDRLIANTEAFINGKKANNVLLYGDNGTGKSSSIKAILNRYYKDGLRMVEVYKHQFKALSEVLEQVKDRNYKFIIYMDDLSFEEFETEYKYLKAVIEGGLEIKPDNVLIYATSNRRHLIRETWTDRTDLENNNGMHKSDTMQEKLSLVNRFGVTINYSKPSQKEYFQIVVGLAEKNGIHMTEEELCAEANKWELSHGGISGRTAQQFINYLAGKQE